MRRMIEVVDGFHREPGVLREYALKECTWSREGLDTHLHETMRTRESASVEHLDRLSALTGEAQDLAPRTDAGHFTFAGNGPVDPAEPRLGRAEWTALVSLTPESGPSASLSFFGTDTDTGPGPETLLVPLRYNRMVLFRSAGIHHTITPGQGDAPSSGRLLQVFAFERAAV